MHFDEPPEHGEIRAAAWHERRADRVRLRDPRTELWTSRPPHSDLMLLLARTTPLEQVERRTAVLAYVGQHVLGLRRSY